MVVTHLPKLHTHFFISTPAPSLYTHHLSLLRIPKSTLTTAAAATSSTTHPPPISTTDTHIQIPLQNLFVPPETDISATSTPLTARILKGSNIVLSKYANDAQVVQAEFVKSSVRTEDCPSDGLPEFALVGRSNVGKSSLLNSLVRRKRLALTSKKPGKTQCINHFRINDSWYLVDLPGYGYAAAPQELRTDWNKFTKDYFQSRSTLVSVFLLVDASIPAKKIDLEYASWLGENQVFFHVFYIQHWGKKIFKGI
ncbi:hypothetical protein PVL29_004212 [Vitis rotundifolia]|uniref:EngB-type G domain-containing protein n=1 Tax=Vitis rotundifolia TaxID=103349 RepID=A0AA39E0P6_VITRO|nr:hypothetical protein PVL29_004212 [Vitis rotundifolia]